MTIFGVGRRLAAVAARRAAGIAVILSIGACAGVEGPPANMENLSADPIARATLQTKYIEGLRLSADLPQYPATQPAPAGDWRLIQRAGIDQIDEACNNYLYTLYRFNAQQKAARQGLLAATATTGVIMGLAGAGTMAIGITAAALGLSAALFEASTNSVLFSVEASAVRNVVQESRSRFAAVMAANPPTTRPDTMIALRGYLSLCTPAVIEANINNAANGSRNSVVTTDEKAGIAAAAMAAPALAPPRTVAQTPEAFISRSTTRGGPQNPPPVVTPEPAPNLQPEERATITTREQVRQLQRALGVKADGDLGPYDPAKLSETRAAIEQFQAGLNAQPGGGDKLVQNGIVDGATYSRLRAAGAVAGLKSGFERGLLTNRTDQFRTLRADEIERVISLLTSQPLQAPATTPDALAKRVQFMREAILAYRNKQGTPVPLSKASDALDSELYKKLEESRPNIPQPVPGQTQPVPGQAQPVPGQAQPVPGQTRP